MRTSACTRGVVGYTAQAELMLEGAGERMGGAELMLGSAEGLQDGANLMLVRSGGDSVEQT